MIETKYFTKKDYVTSADINPYFENMKIYSSTGLWKDVRLAASNVEYKFRKMGLKEKKLTYFDLIDFDTKTKIANIGVHNPGDIFPDIQEFLKNRDFKLFFSFLLYCLSIWIDETKIRMFDMDKKKCWIEMITYARSRNGMWKNRYGKMVPVFGDYAGPVGQKIGVSGEGFNFLQEFYETQYIRSMLNSISKEKNLNHH